MVTKKVQLARIIKMERTIESEHFPQAKR